jgi:hypothetical protein
MCIHVCGGILTRLDHHRPSLSVSFLQPVATTGGELAREVAAIKAQLLVLVARLDRLETEMGK